MVKYSKKPFIKRAASAVRKGAKVMFSSRFRPYGSPAKRSVARRFVRGMNAVSAVSKAVRALRGHGVSVKNNKKAKKHAKKVWGDSEFEGPFPRTRKGEGAYRRFNRDGIVHRKELTGTADDNDCVYAMNQGVCSYDAVRFIISALLRKLFEKAGIRCIGMNEYFPTSNGGVTALVNYRPYLNTINMQTKVVSPLAGPILATNTLYTISTTFLTPFMAYVSGTDNVLGVGDPANLEVLSEFVLMDETTNSIVSQIRLDEVEVELKGISTMKVQNRTLSSDSTASVENVGNSPVEGRIYRFQGIPRHKGLAARTTGPVSLNGTEYFNMCPVDYSCKTWGASSMASFHSDFKEPPPPGAFYNCKSSAHVYLNPGKIKTFTTHAYKKDNLLRLLKKLRIQYGSGGSSYSEMYSIFPTQLLAMEDVINITTGPSVKLAFEFERTLGVLVHERKQKFMRTFFEQQSITES